MLVLVQEDYKLVLVIFVSNFVHNILFVPTFKDLKLLHKAVIITKGVALLNMGHLFLHNMAKKNAITMFIKLANENFICKNLSICQCNQLESCLLDNKEHLPHD